MCVMPYTVDFNTVSTVGLEFVRGRLRAGWSASARSPLLQVQV